MPSLWYGTSGPKDSQIVIVGEAWGESEAREEQPFVGASGQELNRILREAGINRNHCLVTNTSAFRPIRNEYSHDFLLDTDPDAREVGGLFPSSRVISEINRLYQQIFSHPRKLIIAVGNYALWALTNYAQVSATRINGRRVPAGIASHRGSMVYALNSRTQDLGFSNIPLLPIYHPAAILREWKLRHTTVLDLAMRVPLALKSTWDFPEDVRMNSSPEFPAISNFFTEIKTHLDKGSIIPLVIDIETTQQKIITCIGFGTSIRNIISIPFTRREAGSYWSYWPARIEAQIYHLMKSVLFHPNIRIIGQNFNYDKHYFLSHWGWNLKLSYDTMVAQHLLLPGTPKSLDYQASIYSPYYRYWKEDRKVDESSEKNWSNRTPLERLLEYNCLDIYYTLQCWKATQSLLNQQNLSEQFSECMKVNDLTFEMSIRGVKIDAAKREKVKADLSTSRKQLQDFLLTMIPQSFVDPDAKTFWFNSTKQKRIVFEELLRMKLPTNHKTKKATLGKVALKELETKYPLFHKIFEALRLQSSLGVFESTFLSPALESDSFLRSSFNSCGTYTFRFSSNKNPFGRGANLQNIPQGDG